MEVKADSLEDSFAALQQNESTQQLRAELDDLKAKLRQNLISAGRPVLGGEQKSVGGEQFGSFLRTGESPSEGKSLDNASAGAGGMAIPREIDEAIDRTLVSISPIRRISNVVRIGSSNYRKLITNGGTPSGWVGMEALRPETATPTFTEIVPSSGELYRRRPSAGSGRGCHLSLRASTDRSMERPTWSDGDMDRIGLALRGSRRGLQGHRAAIRARVAVSRRSVEEGSSSSYRSQDRG
jgi:predicted phage gp36 major capsid-like protein